MISPEQTTEVCDLLRKYRKTAAALDGAKGKSSAEDATLRWRTPRTNRKLASIHQVELPLEAIRSALEIEMDKLADKLRIFNVQVPYSGHQRAAEPAKNDPVSFAKWAEILGDTFDLQPWQKETLARIKDMSKNVNSIPEALDCAMARGTGKSKLYFHSIRDGKPAGMGNVRRIDPKSEKRATEAAKRLGIISETDAAEQMVDCCRTDVEASVKLREIGERHHLSHEIADAIMDNENVVDASAMRKLIESVLSKYVITSREQSTASGKGN